jgi:Zn-dependent peptidase ImmA (M78 family)
LRRGFKAEANRIALDVRRRVGLTALEPFDIDRVCAHYDIVIVRMTDLPCDYATFTGNGGGSFSAVTVPCGLRTAIVHNDTHHPPRQRSNICHELAHCFLGHKAVPPLNAAGERIHDSGVEAEANFLGGCLLLPNEAAVHVLMNGLKASAQAFYGISKPMLDYRLRVSGAQVIYERSLRRRR